MHYLELYPFYPFYPFVESMHYKKAPRLKLSSRRLGAAPYRTISLRGWWHVLADYRQIARTFICEEPRKSVAIPSCGILSERSSPSRDRFARARGAPLTATGRSEPLSAKKEWVSLEWRRARSRGPEQLHRTQWLFHGAGGLKIVNASANSPRTRTGVDDGTFNLGKRSTGI